MKKFFPDKTLQNLINERDRDREHRASVLLNKIRDCQSTVKSNFKANVM